MKREYKKGTCTICGKPATRVSKRFGVREDGSEWERVSPSCGDCYFICDHGLQAIRCTNEHLFYITLDDLYSELANDLQCPYCLEKIKFPLGELEEKYD